jgi:hypothetical protein
VNTFQWGKWQREERNPNRLELGGQFRLRVVNRDRDFMVFFTLNTEKNKQIYL